MIMTTTYNPFTNPAYTGTSTTVVFQPVEIRAQTAWPGTPTRPLNVQSADGSQLSRSEPVHALINPRWYFKWMRVIIEQMWARVFHIPAGVTTLISKDSCGASLVNAAEWGLFIARPENQNLQVRAYSVLDPRNVYPDPRGIQMYTDPRCIETCRSQMWATVEANHAVELDTCNMAQGSMVFDSGHVFYSIANTGTSDQSIIVLNSRRRQDISDILDDPQTLIKRV